MSFLSQINSSIQDKIDLDSIEITEEGAIAFRAYSETKTLSSAIGDEYYFVVVGNRFEITGSNKLNVSDNFEYLITSLNTL
jgi:hypothetical protein